MLRHSLCYFTPRGAINDIGWQATGQNLTGTSQRTFARTNKLSQNLTISSLEPIEEDVGFGFGWCAEDRLHTGVGWRRVNKARNRKNQNYTTQVNKAFRKPRPNNPAKDPKEAEVMEEE